MSESASCKQQDSDNDDAVLPDSDSATPLQWKAHFNTHEDDDEYTDGGAKRNVSGGGHADDCVADTGIENECMDTHGENAHVDRSDEHRMKSNHSQHGDEDMRDGDHEDLGDTDAEKHSATMDTVAADTVAATRLHGNNAENEAGPSKKCVDGDERDHASALSVDDHSHRSDGDTQRSSDRTYNHRTSINSDSESESRSKSGAVARLTSVAADAHVTGENMSVDVSSSVRPSENLCTPVCKDGLLNGPIAYDSDLVTMLIYVLDR